jgi:hypothetical protein
LRPRDSIRPMGYARTDCPRIEERSRPKRQALLPLTLRPKPLASRASEWVNCGPVSPAPRLSAVSRPGASSAIGHRWRICAGSASLPRQPARLVRRRLISRGMILISPDASA